MRKVLILALAATLFAAACQKSEESAPSAPAASEAASPEAASPAASPSK